MAAQNTPKKKNDNTKNKQAVKATNQKAKQTTAKGGKNTAPKQEESFNDLHDEFVLMGTLVISVLLFLSNFQMSGKVGDVINNITFGLFGMLAYLLPFALFFLVAFYMANRGSRLLPGKLLSAAGMIIMVAAFLQMVSGNMTEQTKFFESYTISAAERNGGGLLGGLLCTLFCPLFGTVGTYVVIIALFLTFFMMLTGKAIFAWIAKQGEQSYEVHKEYRQQRRAENERRYEERLAERSGRTFLLQEEKKEVPKEKVAPEKNFFGGITPTKPHVVNKKETESVQPVQPEAVQVSKFAEPDKVDPKTGELLSFPISGVYETSTFPKSVQESSSKENYHMKPDNTFGNVEVEPVRPLFQEAPMPSEIIQETISVQKEAGSVTKYEETASLKKQVCEIMSESEHVAKWTDTDVTQKDSFEPSHSDIRPSDREVVQQKEKEAGNKVGVSTEKRMPAQQAVAEEEPLVIEQTVPEEKPYVFPSVELLAKPTGTKAGMTQKDVTETAQKLQSTLDSFGVHVTITNVSCGPAVTRYELQPEQGVKVSKITSLADDIKLNLAAADVRIEAPIPGKAAVGIEVPNKENVTVMLRDLFESNEFTEHSSKIAFAVGKDIAGQTIVTDIGKMPHLLIAGATGSGKSVCINTLIMSILYKASPEDVRLIMVDPKVVELSIYNGIPHLLIPVVTEPKKASAALNWAVMEMDERYNKFATLGVRDLKSYNERIQETAEQGLTDEKFQKLPQIVIIVDELADLMMVASGEVEEAICRLAQKARAAGLHLIIATQRPSVNVITGLIKANVPSRIAFAVSSTVDSRTILDGAGAEKLLGKGDMLFFPSGYPKPIRVQGAFVSDREVSAVVDFIKEQNAGSSYSEEVTNKIASVQADTAQGGSAGNASAYDEYFVEAGKFVIEKDKATIGMLQRVYKIGFNRAARIIDQLSEAGVVGPEEGTKPRKVLMSLEEFEQFVDEYV